MGDSSTSSKGQLLDTDLQLLDMAPFGRKVIAFNKLIRRELELMNLVLPLEFHQEVLNIIVSSSLQERLHPNFFLKKIQAEKLDFRTFFEIRLFASCFRIRRFFRKSTFYDVTCRKYQTTLKKF